MSPHWKWYITSHSFLSQHFSVNYQQKTMLSFKDPLHTRGTCVGDQETPGVTGKFGLGIQNEAGQRLIEFCQENALVIANTLFQQHKGRLYRWTSLDGQHRNQIDYILCSQRWRSSIKSAKTRLGADCGSDHELLIVKFRLKLKKVGKTTRPFRYDLNQIPYDYTVEVRNRFERLDLIECLMNDGQRFMTLYRRQGSRPSPWKRNAKRQNGCLRILTNSCEKKRREKGEKERYKHLNAEFQRIRSEEHTSNSSHNA